MSQDNTKHRNAFYIMNRPLESHPSFTQLKLNLDGHKMSQMWSNCSLHLKLECFFGCPTFHFWLRAWSCDREPLTRQPCRNRSCITYANDSYRLISYPVQMIWLQMVSSLSLCIWRRIPATSSSSKAIISTIPPSCHKKNNHNCTLILWRHL